MRNQMLVFIILSIVLTLNPLQAITTMTTQNDVDLSDSANNYEQFQLLPDTNLSSQFQFEENHELKTDNFHS